MVNEFGGAYATHGVVTEIRSFPYAYLSTTSSRHVVSGSGWSASCFGRLGVSHVTVHRHVQCVVTMLVTVFSAVVYYLTLIISASPPDYTPTSPLCAQFIRFSTSLFPVIMFFNVFSRPLRFVLVISSTF